MMALATIPYNIAIANGYTKLNNILGIISLFVTLPGYWLATKHFGAIGAAYVYCCIQIITALIYIYLISKKFLKIERPINLLYVKQMLFPLIISLSIAFVFSIIPDWAAQNRIYAFTWIGLSIGATFFLSLLLFFPFNHIKKLLDFTPVQNKFLTALAKIGPTSYLPFSKTKPKAYVKNNSTCPNDSTVASRKV
jgi:O-antigen/teichoic acid export membrane protein